MTAYVALLRGINVGGRQLVPMADLRDFLAQLGYAEPRTLLQSGNVVFRADRTSAALEGKLAAASARRFGFAVEFFVRTAAEWAKLIARNPFPQAAAADPSHLVVLFLKHAVQPAQVAALRQSIQGPELVEAAGREVYLVYPDGIGASKLTQALLDKHLGGRGTGRNWNTVGKLAALAGV